MDVRFSHRLSWFPDFVSGVSRRFKMSRRLGVGEFHGVLRTVVSGCVRRLYVRMCQGVSGCVRGCLQDVSGGVCRMRQGASGGVCRMCQDVSGGVRGRLQDVSGGVRGR